MIHDEWCRSIPADYILYPSLPPFSSLSLSLLSPFIFLHVCLCHWRKRSAMMMASWYGHCCMGTTLISLLQRTEGTVQRGWDPGTSSLCMQPPLGLFLSLSLSLFLSLFSASSPPGSIDHGNILFFYAYIHVILIWVILIIGCTVRSADKRCGLIFF